MEERFKVRPTIEGTGRGEVFAIKNTCRDMECGKEYCFYPGNKENELYVGGRFENVGRCLAKRMESHKLICECFPAFFVVCILQPLFAVLCCQPCGMYDAFRSVFSQLSLT
jgi:hypothetical protein